MQLQPISVDIDCPVCDAEVRLTEHDTEASDYGAVHVLRGGCPGPDCTATVETRFIEPDPNMLNPVLHGQTDLVAPARIERVQDTPPMFEFRPPTWTPGEEITRVEWRVD